MQMHCLRSGPDGVISIEFVNRHVFRSSRSCRRPASSPAPRDATHAYDGMIEGGASDELTPLTVIGTA